MADTPKVDAIQGHRTESERLVALTAFVGRFAPAIEETKGGFDRDLELSIEMEAARDEAVLQAFKAIERIAKLSFVIQPRSGPNEPEESQGPRWKPGPI